MSERPPQGEQSQESGVDQYLRKLGIDPSKDPDHTVIDLVGNSDDSPPQ
jgi:hypothetical protein